MAYVDSNEEELDVNGNPVTSSSSSTISSGAASTGGGGVGNSSPKTASAGNVNLEEYLNANPGTAESIYSMVTGEASKAATDETANVDTQVQTATDTAATAQPYANQDTNSIITNAVNTNDFSALDNLFNFNSNQFDTTPTISTSDAFNTTKDIFSDAGGTQQHYSDLGYLNPQYSALDSAFYGSGIERGRTAGNEALSALDTYLGKKQGEVSDLYSGLGEKIRGTQNYARTALGDTYNNAVSGFNSSMNAANAGKTGTPSSLTLSTATKNASSPSPYNDQITYQPTYTTTSTPVSYTAGSNPYTASTYGGDNTDRNTANVLAAYLGLPALPDYEKPKTTNTGSTPWLAKPSRNVGR